MVSVMMTEISLLKYRDKDSDKYFADLSGLFGKSNTVSFCWSILDLSIPAFA